MQALSLALHVSIRDKGRGSRDVASGSPYLSGWKDHGHSNLVWQDSAARALADSPLRSTAV